MHDTANSQDPYDHSEPLLAPEREEQSAEIREGESENEIDAEALIHRRPSGRKRAVQGGLALLCVLAVLGLFHVITPAATRPPALAPLAPTNRSQVTIVANLSFGSVTVNGKKLVGKPPFLFSAAPDGDLVIYSAPPFLPQTCRVYWYGTDALAQLGAGGSTCQISFDVVTESNLVTSSYVLTFQFGLGELPVALQATTQDYVRRAIAPASLSLAVSSGQYYATGRDSKGLILSRQATTPLTAVVSSLLPTPQDLAASTAWCSEIICPALGISLVQAATPAHIDQLWVVQIPLIMSWQYLRPDGQRVGAGYQSQASVATTIGLVVDAQQQWQLAPFTSPQALVEQQRQMIPEILCSTGINELSSALQIQHAGQLEVNSSADHGLAGCEIHITHYNGTVTGKVVWRLGVLLAADEKTHTAYPWLPLAPQAEVAAVGGD